MSSNEIVGVMLGVNNRKWATLPEESNAQSKIIVFMKNEKGDIYHIDENKWSGWSVWKEEETWFHLGGSKRKKPNIYKLIVHDDGKPGWKTMKTRSEEANNMWSEKFHC